MHTPPPEHQLPIHSLACNPDKSASSHLSRQKSAQKSAQKSIKNRSAHGLRLIQKITQSLGRKLRGAWHAAALVWPPKDGYVQRCWIWLFGFMGSMALAPYHWWILGVISMGYLFIVGWFFSPRSSWLAGWWWGLGFYIGALYWVGDSLLVDAQRFAWLRPIVVLGGPAFLALFPGIAMAGVSAYRQYFRASVPEYVVAFTLCYGLGEWIQGHILTGFPWNLMGYMWGNILSVMQWAAFFGSYGLSLMTVLWVACMGGVMVGSNFQKKAVGHALMLGCIGLGIASCSGQMRLRFNPTQFHDLIQLRCVQPCIDQKEKMDPAYAEKHWKILQNLSVRPSESGIQPTVVIWPEGAFPWCMTPETMNMFSDMVPDVRSSYLMFGADYLAHADTLHTGLLGYDPISSRSKNSKNKGQGLAYLYGKMHLVPGGEYVPFRRWLEKWLPAGWLAKITPGALDFSPGSAQYILQFPSLPPFRCLICYESIFPGTIRNPVAQTNQIHPEWILTITNDGWFGRSPGPYQHFLSARFRAVEEGLPLVRVANTGISAVVDPLGRIVKSLPLFQQGVLDAGLPIALPLTLYARFQDRIWLSMVGMLALLLIGLRTPQRPGGGESRRPTKI